MTTNIRKELTVPYTCQQMFELVDNVEKYAEFVPWCSSGTVVEKTENKVTATLCFARAGMQKCFTTQNVVEAYDRIEMNLVDGPFRYLHGIWLFEETDQNSCHIRFHLEFEFSNKLIGLAFGSLFAQVANTLVDAFYKRAQEIYGRR